MIMKRINLATLLVLFALTATAHQVEIREARLWEAPDHTRVVFELSKKPSSYNVFTLDNIKSKPRVVIDLKSSQVISGFHRIRYRKGVVKNLRSGKRKGGVVRLVLDLSQKVKTKAFVIRSTKRNGYRLVVDLYKTTKSKQRVLIVDKSSQLNSVPGKKVRKSKKKQVAKNRRSTTRSNSRRASKRAAKHKPRRQIVRDVIVAIDPGHGGEDPGAIGRRHGTREKDVVLKISKYLARMIHRQKGVQAVLVRNGDYYVTLNQRLKIARKVKADILISIHANSAHRSSARGVSVYTLSKRGASSEASKWLADRENRADFVGGAQLTKHHRDDSLAKVLLDLSQTSTLQASVNIAQQVLLELRKVGKVHRGGLEKAGFVVLKSPDIPSILVETGFISNPGEEKKLRSRRYQKQIARYIMKGVLRYFIRNAPPNTRFANRKSIVANDNNNGIAKK